MANRRLTIYLYYICMISLLVLQHVQSGVKSSKSEQKSARKERCRHLVRKEVLKYSRRVQTLTNLVYSQQQDIELVTREQESKELDIELMKSNISAQESLLMTAVANIEMLQRQMRVITTIQPDNNRLPTDCNDVLIRQGVRFLSSYQMMIQPTANSSQFRVLCEQRDNAGWIVIQARLDGSVDFLRNWTDYKNGFGEFESEFWLGNEKIHQITSAGRTILRVELEEFSGEKQWAEYSIFSINNETDNYSIRVGGYRGNAGDDLEDVNGEQFSTFDRDNDSRVTDNCAHLYSAGWWYRLCPTSNLNARYLDESTHESFQYKHGIVWSIVHPYKTLKSSRLLLKPFSGV